MLLLSFFSNLCTPVTVNKLCYKLVIPSDTKLSLLAIERQNKTNSTAIVLLVGYADDFEHLFSNRKCAVVLAQMRAEGAEFEMHELFSAKCLRYKHKHLFVVK